MRTVHPLLDRQKYRRAFQDRAPKEFSQEVLDKVIAKIQGGLHIETACKAVGLRVGDLNHWGSTIGGVSESVDTALAIGESEMFDSLKKATNATESHLWKWILERRWPEHWQVQEHREPDENEYDEATFIRKMAGMMMIARERGFHVRLEDIGMTVPARTPPEVGPRPVEDNGNTKEQND